MSSPEQTPKKPEQFSSFCRVQPRGSIPNNDDEARGASSSTSSGVARFAVSASALSTSVYFATSAKTCWPDLFLLLLLINQRSPHPFSDCRNKSPANVDNCFVPCVGRSGEGRSRIWRQQRSTFQNAISPFLPLAAETYVGGGGRENPMHKTHTHSHKHASSESELSEPSVGTNTRFRF